LIRDEIAIFSLTRANYGAEHPTERGRMISVELAKKLKAAGFREVVLYEESRTVIAPTLTELMDACPKVLDGHNFHLTWASVLGKGDKWVAYYDDGGGSVGIEGYGDSRDEAVANLWLELNRK
jgi:hypothetical protein